MEPVPPPSPESAAPQPAQAPHPRAPYTAVVYFHGMGRQQHYQELCRLVEQLDKWSNLQSSQGAPGYSGKYVYNIKGREEATAVEGVDKTLAYLAAKYDPEPGRVKRLRFYEAYWAPEATGGTSVRAVLLWLVAQVVRPLRLLASPWRAFERIRRADLDWLVAKEDKHPGRGITADVGRTLLSRYDSFFGMAARRQYPRGTFAEFLGSLGAEPSDLAAAKRWRRLHRARQAWSFFLVSTVLLAGFAVFGAVGLGVRWALQNVPVILMWADRFGMQEGLKSSVQLTVALFGLLGFGRILVDYLGDVQQFATYQEDEELFRRRSAILGQAQATLRHVLEEPNCERVVVVAHSLGAAVALDALIGLRRYNQAHGGLSDPLHRPIPLFKLSHLVTMATPIDKISYFFTTQQSKIHRFERLADDLRGDIGQPPFSKSGRQPYLHWINFWDRGDIISGPVHSVAAKYARGQRVDNFQVASYLLPDPGANHSSYFDHPTVLDCLFQTIISDALSFHPAREADRAVDGQRQIPDPLPWIGPGKGSRAQDLLLSVLIAWPWTTAVALVGAAAGHWARPWTLASIGLFGVLAAGLLIHRLRPKGMSR